MPHELRKGRKTMNGGRDTQNQPQMNEGSGHAQSPLNYRKGVTTDEGIKDGLVGYGGKRERKIIAKIGQ
jgi:hypothetical protein